MPNHIECCTKPIIDWLSDNLENFRLNLMDQYQPKYHAWEYEDINRSLKRIEFEEALKYAEKVIGMEPLKPSFP